MTFSLHLAPLLAIGSGLAFTAIVVWLHVRRRDIDPATRGVSHYAVGSTHALMTTAFLTLAFGFLAAASAIGSVEGQAAASRAGPWLLWSAASGIALVAAVPVPEMASPQWRRPVHSAGALLFFASAAAGTLMTSGPLGSSTLVTALLLAGATTLFLISMAGMPGLWAVRGWLQRCCFALTVVWLVVAGWHLRVAR